MIHTTMREDIWIEQILLIRKQLPVIIGSSFLTSAVVAFWLQRYMESTQLAIWMSLVSVLAVIRLLHMQFWRRRSVSAENVRDHIRQFTLLSLVSGMLWGSFGIMTVSQDNPLIPLTAVMVLSGMIASATASLSHFRSAYLAFILPITIPTAIAALVVAEPLSYLIAVLITIYLIVSIYFSLDLTATFIQSIKLRFENTALVASLQEEKAHAVSSMQTATRANFAKSRFLAAASHDLRQPLCALRLYTATLQMLGNNDRQEEIAKNIDVSVVALEELFDSLLDISKLDAGTLEVQIENFSLTTILDRIAVDFNALAAEKGIKFDINAENLIVRSDQQLLERLLRNLVSNAIRYTEKGGVKVRTHGSNSTVRIGVQDTGCGISDADQTQIFDEFVQLNNPARDRTKGIGLGLSIVRRISGLMKIPVNVESTVGQGSVFTLTVPLGDPAEVIPVQRESSMPERNLRNLFVLVVDDEIAIQNAMRSILGKWGCTVVSAGSADEAFIALVEYSKPPDVAIVDLRLRSGENGLDVIKAIQDAFDDPVPSLILTGDIGAEQLKEVQVSKYPIMHKPCDVDKLYNFLYDIAVRI